MQYKTKQREAVLNYIVSHKDNHVTAAQIIAFFSQGDEPIGRTTVYRHLDKLAESGKVRRYITDGVTGACYQYNDNENCHSHFHLKCEECGQLAHLQCDALGDVHEHVLTHHDFHINMMKTVFYGVCELCRKGA